jgi:hypothetical protein
MFLRSERPATSPGAHRRHSNMRRRVEEGQCALERTMEGGEATTSVVCEPRGATIAVMMAGRRGSEVAL